METKRHFREGFCKYGFGSCKFVRDPKCEVKISLMKGCHVLYLSKGSFVQHLLLEWDFADHREDPDFEALLHVLASSDLKTSARGSMKRLLGPSLSRPLTWVTVSLQPVGDLNSKTKDVFVFGLRSGSW